MRALLGRVILVGGFFPFITFSISCRSLLACRVSAEKSADNLIGIPLYVTCFFSLVAFKIFSLSLILVSLINMCLSVCLLGFILYGTHCACWIWVNGSLPILGKFSAIISWNIFFCPLLSLSSFWHPYNTDVGAFNVVPEFSETLFICFQSFFLFSVLHP